MTKTIAFLQYAAMADILYATPILREVRRRNPDSHISWFVRDRFSNVIETNPHLDAIKTYIVKEDYGSKEANERVLWAQMKADAEAGPYDEIIRPQQWPDHDFFRSNDDLLTLMAQNAGIDDDFSRKVELCITSEDVKSVTARFGDIDWTKVVTINHISYAASPILTPVQYSEIAYALIQQGLYPMFTGASEEPIPGSTWDGVPIVLDARGTTYREWAECIRRSSLWLGLDSGAVTLAASTDTPMIKLHSPDFAIHKTGVKAMGLREDDILELTTPPTVDSVVNLILQRRRCQK